QRLSAISSYYAYLTQQGVHDRNPVDAVGRNDLEVNPYERAHKLPLAAFRRILDVIPEDAEIGAMNERDGGRRGEAVVPSRGRRSAGHAAVLSRLGSHNTII
ncbi:MAG: hypothetical protein R6U98_03495, partial [Pirellulaceae bacterium]